MSLKFHLIRSNAQIRSFLYDLKCEMFYGILRYLMEFRYYHLFKMHIIEIIATSWCKPS